MLRFSFLYYDFIKINSINSHTSRNDFFHYVSLFRFSQTSSGVLDAAEGEIKLFKKYSNKNVFNFYCFIVSIGKVLVSYYYY